MANNDWNPDDLLDFHFDHPGNAGDAKKSADAGVSDGMNDLEELIRSFETDKPEPRRGLDASFDDYSKYRQYDEIGRPNEEVSKSYSEFKVREEPLPRATVFRKEPKVSSDDDFFAQFDKEMEQGRRGLVEEKRESRPSHSVKEIEALKQASQEAYDKYRSNYKKNKKTRRKRQTRVPLNAFQKGLIGVYSVALLSFAVSLTVMNVLPAGMAIGLYAVLALLSYIIIAQIRRGRIKKWGRHMVSFLAVLLIVLYGVGTAYALGTLSFLNSTSVENSDGVANITKDPFNVVITGMDVSGKIDEQGRSDVNMVLTVNPVSEQVLMTSIPRDYEVYMPNYDNAMDKLTHTGFYSVETTILAEEDLLDFKANYYVKVNFTTVEKFIDAVGGVDVYSEYEFNPVKMKDWTVKEGMNHMNGAQALAFARERKAFVTGDNQRIKNQQAVLEAVIKKATSSRTMLLNYTKILNSIEDYFEMSFSSRELRALAKHQLAKNPSWKIYKNTIVGGNGSMTTYTTGDQYCYVMTQDEESIENAKTLMQAVMEGRALDKDEDGNVYVVEEEGDETEGTEE